MTNRKGTAVFIRASTYSLLKRLGRRTGKHQAQVMDEALKEYSKKP